MTILLLAVLLAGCEIKIGGTTLSQMLVNLSRTLGPVWYLLIAVCYVTGVWFMVLGFLKLKVYGQMTVMMMSQAEFTGPLLYIVVGTILVYTPTMLDVAVQTFWGYSYSQMPLDYGPSGGDWWVQVYHPVLLIMRVVGLISFIRGWMILSKAGGRAAQPGNFGKGLMHVIAGIFAINIVGTIRLFEATLGISIS